MTGTDQAETTRYKERAHSPGPDNEDPEGNDDHNDDHDCRERMVYTDYGWEADCYVDRYVCSVCEANRFIVFERTHLLDQHGEVLEEYTRTT